MNVSESPGRAPAIVLAVAVLAIVAAGAAVVPVQADNVAAQQTTPETGTAANNTTVRHENPDEAESEETLSELRKQLAGRLGDRLEESSLRLSQDQYERAKEMLGEDYLDTLDKYADVAEEQGNEQTAEDFERAGRVQRNFTDTVREYRETREEYQEAKQEGDDAEARRHARELGKLAEEIDRQSAELNRTYARLENDTSVDFSETRNRVVSINGDVSASNEEIQRAELVGTTLSVATTSREASFTDPLVIDGRLTAADGSPLANRSVDISVADRNHTVRTDATGSFSVAYRPTTLPLSASSVDVRYVPDPTSIYVASTRSVPISVEQVTATVDFESVPDRVAYDDPVEVAGRVRIDTRTISDLPVSISVDNRTIGRTRTTETGRLAIEESMPADVQDGSRSIRVAGGTERAVAVAATSDPFTVVSTPTDLTLSLADDGSSVTAAGRLSADGAGVGGRPLVVFVDGTAVKRTTTTENGAYRIELAPEAVNENATVRVRFDGGGTNLESSSASAVLRPDSSRDDESDVFEIEELFSLASSDGSDSGGSGSAGGSSGIGPSSSDSGPSFEGVTTGAAVAVVVLAAGWYALRRSIRDDEDDAPVEAQAGSAERTPVETGPSPLELLTDGRVQDALVAAYQSVQRSVAPRLDGAEPAMTHRQFYDACRSSNLVPMEALDTLSSAYEQAVYSDRELSFEQARDAVLAARRLVSETSDGQTK